MTDAVTDEMVAKALEAFEGQEWPDSRSLEKYEEASIRAALNAVVPDILAAERNRHAAAMAQSEAEAWRPIETAMEVRGTILLYSSRRKGVLLGYYDKEDECFREATTGEELYQRHEYDDRRPTHWRPIPAPPAALRPTDAGSLTGEREDG